MYKSNTKKIVILAFLVAISVILTRFCSINTDILRIGFGWLPAAIAGIMFGPIWAGAAYAVADVLGMMIFPSGSFFPGFTLTAFITGCVYGYMYKKQPSVKNIIIPVLIVCMVLNLILDTLWLKILLGQGYFVLLPPRIIKCAVMVPIQFFLIQLCWKKIIPKVKI